nr:hypothetical protein GCM10020092_079750 [Actinoplanes digitatis]
MQMRDRDTLEFGVDAGGWATASADVPPDWYGNWHRVSGVYDGAALRLYIDGREAATTPRTGAVDPGLFEVNLGHNAETQRDNDLWSVRTARGLIDDARVYAAALTPAQLAGDPTGQAVLALNFDAFQRKGDFLSLGISLSGTDGLVGSDRYLQPETREMAWAQAPIRFTAVDAVNGRVRVHNEQQAGAFRLRLRYQIIEQARTIRSGSRPLTLAPRPSRRPRPRRGAQPTRTTGSGSSTSAPRPPPTPPGPSAGGSPGTTSSPSAVARCPASCRHRSTEHPPWRPAATY